MTCTFGHETYTHKCAICVSHSQSHPPFVCLQEEEIVKLDAEKVYLLSQVEVLKQKLREKGDRSEDVLSDAGRQKLDTFLRTIPSISGLPDEDFSLAR